MKSKKQHFEHAFTIVELLIVIVIIAILAAITVVAYNGIQSSARTAKIQADLSNLSKAIQSARINESKTMMEITGTWYTSANCASKTVGTSLASLSRTDSCWTDYSSTLQKLSDASGVNVANLVDPWGAPYYIDENESVAECANDRVAAFKYPFDKTTNDEVSVDIPFSGFTNCS